VNIKRERVTLSVGTGRRNLAVRGERSEGGRANEDGDPMDFASLGGEIEGEGN
jgi:hypothetical protein